LLIKHDQLHRARELVMAGYLSVELRRCRHGRLAGENRSYRRLVRVLDQLGIPARASRLAAWRELARRAPPAILADALGVSAGTAMRHAFLSGADWSVYAARRQAHTPGETSQ
jgi:hypothetical protein